MKKYIRHIVIVAIALGLLTWSVGAYLAPDDLSSCGDTPTTTDPGSGVCAPADAIVAVSGGDTQARAAEAISLYKNGWGTILVFSGAAADKSGPSNAATMKQQAVDAGVDAGSIVIDEVSDTTAQNAEQTTNIFKQHGITSAILVTSGYHMRRASLEFNKRALGVTIRSHPVAQDKHWGPFWWLTARGWILAIPECVMSLILSTGGMVR